MKENKVSNLVYEARNGSLEAKQNLIERYMYIVDKSVGKYNIDIDSEEAKQIGYLYLTQKINDYLNNGYDWEISSYVISRFNDWFPQILLKEKIKNEQNYGTIDAESVLDSTDFDEFNLYFELFDFLDREEIKDRDKLVLERSLSGDKQLEISKEFGLSTAVTCKIVKRNRKVLKKFLDIK